jgi:hypothetical protein
MFQSEVLVREFGPVDGSTACAVPIEEIAALDHEVLDLRSQVVSILLAWVLKSSYVWQREK